MKTPTYIDVVHSIDCFAVWFSRRLSPKQISHLRTLNYPHPVVHKAMIMIGAGNEGWVHRVRITVPKAPVFDYLEELAKTRDYLCNDLELAKDLITTDTPKAKELRDYFKLHLVRKWSRNTKTVCGVEGEDTVYTDPRDHSLNLDAYVRDSKINGEPCCHVELRIKGAGALKQRGIRSFDDLRHLDVAGLIDKRLSLLALRKKSLPLLGKQFLPKGTPRFNPASKGSSYCHDRYLRTAHTVLRLCQTKGGIVDYQKLKRKLAKRKVSNPQRFFQRLDIEALKSA